MLPLGDWWTGVCHAVPGAPQDAGGIGCDTSRGTTCNLGYARGECARFPEGDGPDAVRFTISSHEGAAIGIYYVVERDHHPFAHGAIGVFARRGRLHDAARIGDAGAPGAGVRGELPAAQEGVLMEGKTGT